MFVFTHVHETKPISQQYLFVKCLFNEPLQDFTVIQQTKIATLIVFWPFFYTTNVLTYEFSVIRN